MADKLTGKVALVTGGSRGIGAAIAKRLAADGAAVALTYVKGREPAERLVRQIESTGGRAIALQADTADPKQVTASVEESVRRLGRLDILVNNAGIGVFKPFEETTDEEIDQLLSINVRGPIVAIRAALKHLKPGGRIINIGSCVGERIQVGGLTVYAATKGAVRMLTQGLSRELGPRGITVTSVAPGPIDTDMNPAEGPAAAEQLKTVPLGRYGKAEEVAALVSFLAGPEATFSTGSAFTIDGGINA